MLTHRDYVRKEPVEILKDMLISALTRKPLRRRMRRRRARKAQGTRSLIPGKGGCDRDKGGLQELLTLVSLTFWGFL